MLVYALDGLLFLLVSDLLNVGFHVFALLFIWQGFKALRQQQQMEENPLMA